MVYYILLGDILLIACIFLRSYRAWKNTMQVKKNIFAYHVLKPINRVYREKLIINLKIQWVKVSELHLC